MSSEQKKIRRAVERVIPLWLGASLALAGQTLLRPGSGVRMLAAYALVLSGLLFYLLLVVCRASKSAPSVPPPGNWEGEER